MKIACIWADSTHFFWMQNGRYGARRYPFDPRRLIMPQFTGYPKLPLRVTLPSELQAFLRLRPVSLSGRPDMSIASAPLDLYLRGT